MAITEAEAREKWCPFARVHIDQNPSDFSPVAPNRNLIEPAQHLSNCIASDCMAWRWEGVNAQRNTANNILTTKVGCCGMAGRTR